MSHLQYLLPLTLMALLTATLLSGTCHLLHRLWNRANRSRNRSHRPTPHPSSRARTTSGPS